MFYQTYFIKVSVFKGGGRLKDDHRVRVTKIIIKNTFLSLLSHKKIKDITVKELCSFANINRGTFYAHYTDIYDLLSKIENELLENFKLKLQPLSNSTKENIISIDVCTSIFNFIKENMDICSIILSENLDSDILYKMLELGKEQCIEVYSKIFINSSKDDIENYYYFVSYGCLGLLKKWINENMKTPIEDISKTAEILMAKGIKFLK